MKRRFPSRRTIRSESGATAIEYAIIGALIGIGLVGSLLGTKGSLNAVFGTAATQIGSGGVATPPLTATQAYWQAKTLQSKQVSGNTATFRYADGTQAQFTTGFGGNFDTRMTITDPTTNQKTYLFTDTSGRITSFSVEDYAYGLSNAASGYVCASPCNSTPSVFSGDPPVAAQEMVVRIAANGSSTTQTLAPTASFNDQTAMGWLNYGYFQGLSKP